MVRPTTVLSWPSLTDAPSLYPDARGRQHRGPYLYRAGKAWPLRGRLDVDGRLPVLAVGSNAYPRQLRDKLVGGAADLQGVPTVPAILRDYDVAWCPIVSRRGYVPVTLAERPGAVCLTWLQWLTPNQLAIISATEGCRYRLVGGAQLAVAAQLPRQLRPPPAIYAWWFDSVAQQSGSTQWFDVYRRQSATDIELSSSATNPVPLGWEIVPRG